MKKTSKALKILSSYRDCIRQGIVPDTLSDGCCVSSDLLEKLRVQHQIACETFFACSTPICESSIDKLSLLFIEPTGILLHIVSCGVQPISAGFSFLRCGTTAVTFSLQDGIPYVTQPEENFPIFFDQYTIASAPISIMGKQYVIGALYQGHLPHAILLLILRFLTREIEHTLSSRCFYLKKIEGSHLTNRQKEVLLLMAAGLSDQEIAERMYISPDTVRYHKKQIYASLDARNAAEAVVKGLLTEEIGMHEVADYRFE